MAFKRIMERAGIKGRLLREANGAGALAIDLKFSFAAPHVQRGQKV